MKRAATTHYQNCLVRRFPSVYDTLYFTQIVQASEALKERSIWASAGAAGRRAGGLRAALRGRTDLGFAMNAK
eukprot:6181256-Pleurochrysis_carterae.AAC.4